MFGITILLCGLSLLIGREKKPKKLQSEYKEGN